MSTFVLVSIVGHLAVTAVAWKRRGRAFAIFAFVYIGIYTAISLSLRDYLPPGPLLPILQGLIYFHFIMLGKPKLRPPLYRALVSIPASAWTAGTVLALPWAVAGGFGAEPHGLWIPYALAAVGTYQSLRARREEKDLHLDGLTVKELRRHPLGAGRVERPLRIVQITDPHLGPFMSEERLAAICRRAVAWEPDLVLLTGDFLTMEGQGTPEALGRALAPLKEMQGRTFACRGNHDLESPRIVAQGLAQAGVRLLIDEAETVETPAGTVQIVGVDHRWRDRRKHLVEILARHPRAAGAMRVVLLHDPGAFRLIPDGEADLVLSGHTHGGQVGFVSLGIPWTFLRLFVKMPDHGLWALGRNRLYVHRAHGHYGFPLRVGVPAEESLLRVHWDGPDLAAAVAEP